MSSCIPSMLRSLAVLLAAVACLARVAAAETASAEPPSLREVDATELSSLLTHALRQEWRIEDGDLVVALDKAPPEVRIPAGEVSIRWITRLSQPSQRAFPQFELVVDGRPAGRHALPLRIEWFREVWIVESPLAVQAPLHADSLKRKRMDVLSVTGAPWMGDPAEDECTVVSPVASGSILMDRHLRKRPLIHRGETVAARLQDGSLSVEFQAVALDDGYRGGSLRVRSLLKPVEMRGKVLNETTVVVAR